MKNSLTEISRCLCAIDSAVARRRGAVVVAMRSSAASPSACEVGLRRRGAVADSSGDAGPDGTGNAGSAFAGNRAARPAGATAAKRSRCASRSRRPDLWLRFALGAGLAFGLGCGCGLGCAVAFAFAFGFGFGLGFSFRFGCAVAFGWAVAFGRDLASGCATPALRAGAGASAAVAFAVARGSAARGFITTGAPVVRRIRIVIRTPVRVLRVTSCPRAPYIIGRTVSGQALCRRVEVARMLHNRHARRWIACLTAIGCVHGVVSACNRTSHAKYTRAPGDAEPQLATAAATAGDTATGNGPIATGSGPAATAATSVPASNAATPPVPLRPGHHDASLLRDERIVALLQRNLDPAVSLPETLLAARIATWRPLPLGERVARWARLFAARNDNRYCFGPKAGCYVAESLLVQDFRLDCVSLFYRCNELARATSPQDAVLWALTTRFAGAELDRVVSASGGVDYDHPAHLDYSEDFAATGIWGPDVTRAAGGAVADAAGTSRYPAGTRWFIPAARVPSARIESGDLLLFVLDEKHPRALALRRDYGLLVGHQALADVANGVTQQIHAAQSPIAGVYTGDHVVRVPLRTYLQRVERFKGIMVVRPGGDIATDLPAAPGR